MMKHSIIGFCMALSTALGCGDDVNVGAEGRGGGGGSGSNGGGTGSGEICTCLEGCGTCPTADVVAIADYGYSIDRTEVTNAHYALFVAANVLPQAAWSDPEFCDWNETYMPKNDWPALAGRDDHPVVWVDRCDALAFCEWAGKHLCGKIGFGSEAGVSDWNSPTQSEWYNACAGASSGVHYPYGASYDATLCNGLDSGAGDMVSVGASPKCHGTTAPYNAVFDMSGNVAEWAERNKSGTVVVRGGSYRSSFTNLACSVVDLVFDATAADVRGDLGFRCCGD